MASQLPPRPFYMPSSAPDRPEILALIKALHLEPHVEGGFFVETDRDPSTVPSPFPRTTLEDAASLRPGFDPALRSTSTSILYLLTPCSPQGHFHRNRGRTVHSLHRGRGQYVLLREDGALETIVVGPDVKRGERMQWIVEGGVWKASFLLPDREKGEFVEAATSGLLITETVVPGFEYCDHEFMKRDVLVELLGRRGAEDLNWLVKRN